MSPSFISREMEQRLKIYKLTSELRCWMYYFLTTLFVGNIVGVLCYTELYYNLFSFAM